MVLTQTNRMPSAMRREESLIGAALQDAQPALGANGVAPTVCAPGALGRAANCLVGYQVVRELGRGGTGVVYLAHDSHLDRNVAIKTLAFSPPAECDLLHRFRREARLLASLSHPNIATIYAFAEDDDSRALVMEYVDGQTLADRLRAGPLPVDEALSIAAQIAAGVEAAHEAGVIHRDLKPGNIMLNERSQVKVLDFGLARGTSGNESHSLWETQPHTVIGTPGYMSPEQLRSKPVDKRTDTWAFGCVLYELLTGRRAFAGSTNTEMVAAILEREPDWTALADRTPSRVAELLRHCFEKDPARRLRDIGDARLELERAIEQREWSGSAIRAPYLAGRTRRRPRSGLLLATALVGVASFASWHVKPADPGPLRRFRLPVDGVHGLGQIAVSPDGRRVAYASAGQLWVRDLAQFEPFDLPDTDGALRPFWSPDSAHVGFASGDRLWSVSAAGGGLALLATLPHDFSSTGGAAWQPDGRVILSTGLTGLLGVRVSDGDLNPLIELDRPAESDFHDVSPLPDGRGVLFVVHRRTEGLDTIAALAGGQRLTIVQLPGDTMRTPVYAPSGHILFCRTQGTRGIWALPFSVRTMRPSAEPFLVARDGHSPSVSADGTLVYATDADSAAAAQQLVWVDRSGQVEREVGRPHVRISGPAISPDELRVAFAADDGDGFDLWACDLSRGACTRLTATSASEQRPVWMPDGRRIAYHVLDIGAAAAFIVHTDGTGSQQELGALRPASHSGHADLLAFEVRSEQTAEDIGVLDLADGASKTIVQSTANERHPQVSPDGRWVAYESDETGRSEIYVKRFPEADGKWQVSVGGGEQPRWSPRGDELFFVRGESLWSVTVATSPASTSPTATDSARSSLSLSVPQKLFTSASGILLMAGYQPSGDANRFLTVRETSEGGTTAITVVENWFAEFAGH